MVMLLILSHGLMLQLSVRYKIYMFIVCLCLLRFPEGFITETLIYLKLSEVTLDAADFVSLPCLKPMHLEHIFYPNEATFERLVSCCPVLEELIRNFLSVNKNAKFFRVLLIGSPATTRKHYICGRLWFQALNNNYGNRNRPLL